LVALPTSPDAAAALAPAPPGGAPTPRARLLALVPRPVRALCRTLGHVATAPVRAARVTAALVRRIRRDGLPRPRLIWEYPAPRAAAAPPAKGRLREAWSSPAGGLDRTLATDPGDEAAAAPRRALRPEVARAQLADRLWGEGFALPGGDTEVARLSGLLPLSPATTLLLIGQDGGGAIELVARTRGTWVAPYLADPAQAARAAERLRPLGRRAAPELWEGPAPPALRPRFHHHALLLEPLRSTAGDPGALLAAVANGMKPGGQIVLLEMVAERPQACPARWLALEGRETPPPAAAEVAGLLHQLGFAVHVTEDASQRQRAAVVEAWSRLMRELAEEQRGGRRDRGLVATLVAEAETWLLRERLLSAGVIRLLRWHATLARAPG
jgi:hypothetical protein